VINVIFVSQYDKSVFFLVIENLVGYLVNYDEGDDPNEPFGYMCPCCMYANHRQDIMKVVREELDKGTVQGKIKWCCHKQFSEIGNRLEEYAPLDQTLFCSGDALQMSSEAKEKFREVAAAYLAEVAQGKRQINEQQQKAFNEFAESEYLVVAGSDSKRSGDFYYEKDEWIKQLTGIDLTKQPAVCGPRIYPNQKFLNLMHSKGWEFVNFNATSARDFSLVFKRRSN
jgi:hypothetical protein